jgi:hypothetical protein
MGGVRSSSLLAAGRLLALAGVLSSGCFAGYDFVNYEGALGDVRTVAIEGLRNESLVPGVDSIISDAIATEFRRRGALRVVEDPHAADLLIKGKVGDVRTAARSFSSVSFALEYSVTIALDLQLRRPDGTEVSIDDRALRESELYFASADVETTRRNRDEAIRRIAVILAGRIHDALYQRSIP